MGIKIALAGNPNCGKTTLFNALTGSNQFVGNWPGVTVEKKEGKLKKNGDVIVTDLPGIYSLSPYTLEEVVARNYLVGERPDAILNIVDGTNLERNLYLTTQLAELGIPVVVAINMMDILRKNGDKLDIAELSKRMGLPVVEISALKSEGIEEAADMAIKAAAQGAFTPKHSFSGVVEHALAHIEEAVLHDMPGERQRWYSIKIFERDEKVIKDLGIDKSVITHLETDIAAAEKELDDDAESIITNERYEYITAVTKTCFKRKNPDGLTVSDKIDKVMTNRFAALPIFAAIMFLVYFISVSTVGAWATDWANDGVFGEGWHFLAIGSKAYGEAVEDFEYNEALAQAFETAASEAGVDPLIAIDLTAKATFKTSGDEVTEVTVDHQLYLQAKAVQEPSPDAFGVWVPGIPVIVGNGLEAVDCAPWLQSLILDGIVGGVGAVLGFVPQIFVLFMLLAFLEACGYMARIAFVMDRIFRKFGLSGKSFIPMLIGTGCSVPGIMASRTIENKQDRRMTITTTSFMPCSAKLPVIALIAGALFNDAWWVAPSAYFVGIAAILVSGIMLKKSKLFAGEPSPFVMELPAYHMPTATNVLRSTWERGWSFIKKAGTIILLSTVVLWFLMNFGVKDGAFGMLEPVDMDRSVLAVVGNAIAWIFIPLGFGNWESAVAVITGLIAKENVVGTFGIVCARLEEVSENGNEAWAAIRQLLTPLSAYSFLLFNLLCAPCFAAIGAIRREMNDTKWTWFAIGYQTVFAYAVSLIVYQLGSLFTGNGNPVGAIFAFITLGCFIYLLARPSKNSLS